METFFHSLIALISAASCAASAMAENFSLPDVQMHPTAGTKNDAVFGTSTWDEKLTSIRFEHFDTVSLGENYFSLDFLHVDRAGGMKFNADGLLLASRPEGLGTNALFQPELGLALDNIGNIEAGIRFEHARYTAGGTRCVSTTPNPMLRWDL